MFRFFLIALLLVKGAVSTSCVAEPVAQDSFFEPVVSAEHELDPDQLYPKGRLFPVSLYSVIKDDLPMLKEDGFTAVGPCYDKDQEKIIAYAQIAHLPTFYAVGIKMNFLSKEPLDLTDEQIREKITQQVSFAAGHPEIAWWYIHPEELRWWVKREMNYMKVVYQAIKAADPLNRPVWMYEANNRACTEKGGMQITLQNQDICGKGIYVNRAGHRENRIWVRWSIEQELSAVEQTEKEDFPIAVLDMSQDADPEHEHLIHSWTRHDAYLSLVMGAKGIMIWSGYRNRRGFENHFDDYYQGYASVAKELTGEPALGKVFLFGERRGDLTMETLSGPKMLHLKVNAGIASGSFNYPSITSAEFAYGSRRYLFLVNSANEPVKVKIGGLPDQAFLSRKLFGDTKEEAGKSSFEISIPPLGVEGFIFRSL